MRHSKIQHGLDDTKGLQLEAHLHEPLHNCSGGSTLSMCQQIYMPVALGTI